MDVAKGLSLFVFEIVDSRNKEMKIGLLTYHHSSSYGATLQTYATCKVLEQLGHEVTIINLALAEYSFSWKSILVIPNRVYRECMWKKIYPQLTQSFETSEALREAKFDFDILLVGSDRSRPFGWRRGRSG